MHTSHLLLQIDQITQNFIQNFGQLNAEQLNWKPNAKTWSIAQNIDHLMVINNTYPPIIQEIRSQSYRPSWLSKIGFIARFFGQLLLKAVQPNRKRKIKTLPIWEPSQSKFPSDLLLQFEQHQQALKSFMTDCEDLLEKGTIIGSPANKNIVYPLETAFEIIVVHEKRHFEQAKELLAQLPKELV